METVARPAAGERVDQLGRPFVAAVGDVEFESPRVEIEDLVDQGVGEHLDRRTGKEVLDDEQPHVVLDDLLPRYRPAGFDTESFGELGTSPPSSFGDRVGLPFEDRRLAGGCHDLVSSGLAASQSASQFIVGAGRFEQRRQGPVDG
jgi:hypothetical protein